MASSGSLPPAVVPGSPPVVVPTTTTSAAPLAAPIGSAKASPGFGTVFARSNGPTNFVKNATDLYKSTGNALSNAGTSIKKTTKNVGQSISRPFTNYAYNKELKLDKVEFNRAQKAYIEEQTRDKTGDAKIAATEKAILEFNTGATTNQDYTAIKNKYDKSTKAVEERKKHLLEKKIEGKKEAKIEKLSANAKKDIEKAAKLYPPDSEGYQKRVDEINQQFDKDKIALEDKYDPSKPQEKKEGFISRIIDSQIKKYAPPEDVERLKEMKKDYLEAFKTGNFEAVNQKYQERGLEENRDVNDYMNGLLSNDKIDRRKGIEMLKAKMNEDGIDDEQQKAYIGIMKDFKDDFDIKSFDDQLSGAYPPKDKELQDLIINFKNIVNKNAKGKPLNLLDKELYDNIDDRIDEIKAKINNDQTRPQTDDIEKLKEYVNSIKSNVEINIEDVMQTTKQIIDFKQIAHYFSLLIKFLATICIVIFIIVLMISFFNVFNLSVKIITNIISIFYNKVITNNQIISYEAKNMTKCSKSNYKDDMRIKYWCEITNPEL